MNADKYLKYVHYETEDHAASGIRTLVDGLEFVYSKYSDFESKARYNNIQYQRTHLALIEAANKIKELEEKNKLLEQQLEFTT